MNLEDRLINWGNAQRCGMRLETCGSAEKFYNAPWRQWVELKDVHISVMVDMKDADIVEQVWKSLEKKEREILKWHYIRRQRKDIVCQRARIKPWQFDAAFARAHYHMRVGLDAKGVGNGKSCDANCRCHQDGRSVRGDIAENC